MWNPETMELMPGFWPPRPHPVWTVLLEPLRRYYLHRFYSISRVTLEGIENLRDIKPGDGALLAPNHSHDSDPHVMMDVGKTLGRQLYFMAAWQVFRMHHGIDGWVMQRMGAFSVDREGCDRRAIRQATELLGRGDWLVVFPEGEIYHTNERLTPLREGVAFMALQAQRDADKANTGRSIWIVPTAIHYRYDEDVTPALNEAVAAMEKRFFVTPKHGDELWQRIMRLGELLLTIKEKEKLGRAQDSQGDLPVRLKAFVDTLLRQMETKQFGKTSDDDSVPLRVKLLRRALLEKMCDEKLDDPSRNDAHDMLENLHLVLQLYSYPGDYIAAKPSVERMAETIEKFEEDVDGITAFPKGKRSAIVRIGKPISVKPHMGSRARTATTELTGQLEEAIKALMTQ
jgi:1-acyl-sn-glycerol-3-phosphate acyltransferase